MDDEEEVPLWVASQQYSYEYSGHKRQKAFNDNVHGHFQLHRASVAIIDTPEFQRLRNLKQLGLAYKIFPTASHNRFEHSLGVAHLASQWGHHLISSRDGVGEDGWQLRRMEPEDRQHLTVLQLAGLTHDLGHGPFSHVFEKELLPRLGLGADVVKNWEHETMSNKILDHLLEDPENGIDLQDLARLDEDHVDLIKRLMKGSREPEKEYAAAPWLFDVVANKRNGIDVDKFDYLKRDAMMCGVGNSLDVGRLMMFSRLSPNRNQVVFKQTEYSNLAVGLFQTRAEMHRRVYTHQKIKSVEFMVCDAMVLVAQPLGLLEAVGPDGCVEAYIKLDDSLLQQVKKLVPEAHEKPGDVRKAQELLQQLERRKLYKYVSEVTLDVNAQQRYAAGSQGKPTAEEIVGYQSTAENEVSLNPDDIIVCEIHIDQGMKATNPMTNVRFYQTADPEGGDEPFAMPQQQVTSMLGTVYQDKIIRVYSKDPDPKVIKALKYAFTQWSHMRHNCQPPGTPWRQPQAYQQAPRPPPSVERYGSRGAAAAFVAGAAAAAGVQNNLFFRGSDASNNNGQQQQQEQEQHMGSQGRSRKRSLHTDMAAASGGGSQGQQQQQPELVVCSMNGSSQGSERAAKVSRASGSCLPQIAEERDY